MNIIVFYSLIAGLQIVASEGSSICMVDCTSLLTPRPPSLTSNTVVFLVTVERHLLCMKEKDRVSFILCPLSVPTSCIKHNSCIALLQAFPNATSGYYRLTLIK